MSDKPDNVREVPNDAERLRDLLDHMLENEGLVGLRLSFEHDVTPEGRLRTLVFMTHSMGRDVEKIALEHAIPIMTECHEKMLLNLSKSKEEPSASEASLCPACGTIAVLGASHARACVDLQLALAARRGESCPWCRGRLTSDERFNLGPPVFDHHHSCPRSRE